MSKPDSEAGGPTEDGQCSEAPQVLKQRVRALNDAAAAMSRANVAKNGQMTRKQAPGLRVLHLTLPIAPS